MAWREESEGGDELPDIPEHGNGQEEIFIEGEPVTKSVEKQSKTKARSNKKKVDKQPTRPASRRKITRPKKFMDAGEADEENDEEERAPKRQRPITSQVKSQFERFQEEN